MDAAEAYALIQRQLYPNQLTYIQKLVFLGSWNGKSYADLAQETGYDFNYLKEVGSHLWGVLSEALGERVTKKNLALVIRGGNVPLLGSTRRLVGTSGQPGRPLAANSHLYVKRPPLESDLRQAINQSGCLLHLEGPTGTGKTSLVHQVLSDVTYVGWSTVYLNLHQEDGAIFAVPRAFWRWLCTSLAQALGMDSSVDTYWNEDLGSKGSCTAFLEYAVLTANDRPLVLVLDDLQVLEDYPQMATELGQLLQVWYATLAHPTLWERLRLVLVHRPLIHLDATWMPPLVHGESTLQTLPFTLEQVHTLAERLGVTAGQADLEGLVAYVGGNPYLVHLGLVTGSWSQPETLLQLESVQQHLQVQEHLINSHTLLTHGWHQVLHQPDQVLPLNRWVRLLERLGLVRYEGHQPRVSCNLYYQALVSVGTLPQGASWSLQDGRPGVL